MLPAVPVPLLRMQVTIPTLGEASAEALAPLLGGLPLELRPKMEAFIQGVYAVRVQTGRAGFSNLITRRTHNEAPIRCCVAAATASAHSLLDHPVSEFAP